MLVGLAMIVSAYLVGSIPIGLLVGKAFFGIDIRSRGSGNLGATNCYRILGPVPGIAVFITDVAKGAVPVWVALMLSRGQGGAVESVVPVLAGMAAIAGHNWSAYLGFRGGKGVSTAAGVLLVLFPAITVVLAAIWLVVLGITRYVSLGSIVIAVAFPVLVVVFEPGNWVHMAFSLIASAVVLFKHRSNMRRILAGAEPKILSGKSQEC